MSPDVIHSRLFRFLYGLICLFALTFLFRGELELWHASGPILFPFMYWRRILLGGVLLLAGVCVFQRRWPAALSVEFALLAILLVFVSDWLDNAYSLLRGPGIRGEILLGSLISGMLFQRGKTGWVKYMAVSAMVALFVTLVYAARGAIIFSDDHPVFLQRLILLKQNFPAIPFYNPLWNAGIDQRDFFATGALNIFFLLAPLIYLLDLSVYYTHLVGVLLFFIVPAAIAGATWMYGRSSLQTAIAAILGVGNSLIWYRWALKYGTLGFICASALIPLVLVLAILLLDRNTRWSWKMGALLVIATTLMLLWSPTGLVLIPMGIWSLARLGVVLRERSRWGSVIGVLLINIPWILLFISVSRVGTYVSKETSTSRRVVYEAHVGEKTEISEGIGAGLATSLKIVREWASSENPLILMLTLPGIAVLRRGFRVPVAVTVLWAALLGTAGSIKLPQLELDRMLLIAGLIATIPVSALIEQAVVQFQERALFYRILTALLFGFLCTTPFSTGSILVNRTVEHYQTATPLVADLADAITTFGGSGRVLFSGFVLHELNGGHLAPLVFWSKHQLIASSHVHDKWTYTNVVPEIFMRRGEEGIEEFFDLLNVTAVIAHEKSWIEYFQTKPARYRKKWSQERFVLFERVSPHASYFLEGSGVVNSFTSSRITVTPASDTVLIKYNYYDFLTADGCQISGAPVSEHFTFIKLTSCIPGKPVQIHAKPAWYRLGALGK